MKGYRERISQTVSGNCRRSVYVRHTPREMVVSNPGRFPEGITPENILTCEPKQRNRLLAEIFEKVGLVERAGIGRRRIFMPTLSFGKRPPLYEADEHTVRLTIFNGSFDEKMAALVANRQRQGDEVSLEMLLLLSHLREHPEIDVPTASKVLQRPEARARDILDRLSMGDDVLLERRGKKRGVTYHLSRHVAENLIGRAAYIRVRGIDPIRYKELIREYVTQHGSIANRECRELLGLGNSPSAQVKATNILKSCDFLEPFGDSPKTTRYRFEEQTH